MDNARQGSRFDSSAGSFSVLYFGTTREVCFGETLAAFRPSPALPGVEEEWAKSPGEYMRPGHVPADWRTSRTSVQVEIDTPWPFVDLEAPETLAFLRKQEEVQALLAILKLPDLDVSTVRGPDRRLTRFISEWLWGFSDPTHGAPYAGIRYESRLNSKWECWAVFDDVDLVERRREPIALTSPGLAEVCELYGIKVF